MDAIAAVQHVADVERLTGDSFRVTSPPSGREKEARADAAPRQEGRRYANGSTTNLRNVLPIMISSPFLISVGDPGCSR